MNKTLEYIITKFQLSLDPNSTMHTEIPNFGRNNLPQLFTKLGFNIGAEVGVMRGEFAQVLASSMPGLRLYCIDPWQVLPDYEEESHQEVFDAYYQEAKSRLAPYNCKLIREPSLDAARKFTDQSLDFVYIDGNHTLQHVINDIATWSKKVKVGGIISGHDYKLHKPSNYIHVYQAVNAYVDAHEIKPWFVLGRYSKKPGMTRDRSRSWMWVKLS